ncbi:hypothetical protein D3C71_1536800 [compost metagenome]
MSTYELRVCKILDLMLKQDKIFKWEYTKDKIKYIGLDNKCHNYLIDFKVYRNETEFFYLEVKGVQRGNDALKWAAVKKNGYELDVWFLHDIEKNEQNFGISIQEVKDLIDKNILKRG